jgi:hypothetical protein
MRGLLRLTLVCAAAAASAAVALAQQPKNDYTQPATWLCRPDNNALCEIDLTTTAVAADGKLNREPFVAAKNPAIDCFYVYPTVSRDPTPNSDMVPNDEERAVAARQLARFGSQCRIFAPLYRQMTLTALRTAMTGGAPGIDRELAYRDVVDAWNDYLTRDNGGRGVVIYGHSQGSSVLKRLIAEEIDGKPVQKRVVSVILLGTNVLVPKGGVVGGDFKSIPLCSSPSQYGCLVTFASFRDTRPPPQDSLFGRSKVDGMQVACTNPAALGGGKAVIDSVFGATSMHPSALPPKPWTTSGTIETPFVRVPGLISAECIDRDGASYLAISTNADPADPRTDEITGDHYSNGQLSPRWGMHSLDVPVSVGSLLQLVSEQAKAYAKANAP